jgi:hypothetical protein
VNPASQGLQTCVINVIDTAPSGSANTAANGTVSLSLSLRSHVYLTGLAYGATTPCPRCIGGLCSGGQRSGLACTAGSPTSLTSIDCPPLSSQWVAPLAISFTLSSNTSNLASSTGLFCPGQQTGPTHVGAFGVGLARDIVLNGIPSPAGLNGSPHQATLGGPFCIPGVNLALNGTSDLPGPGGLSLVTDITLLP